MRGRIEAVLDELEAGASLGAGRAAGRGRGVPALDRRRAISPCSAAAATSSRTAPTASQLRRMKGTGLGILRAKDDGALSQSFSSLPAEIRERAREPLPLLTITKANTRSTVHRGTYLDFIGVKRFAPDGSVVGEHRFLGLLTSAAYSMSPRQIPLIDRKVERVDRARRRSRRPAMPARRLLHILETYPRDELLQTSEDELFEIAIGILHLQDRPRLRLFVRRDPFGRFVSLPRLRPARPLQHRACASAWSSCCARRSAPPRASSRRSCRNPSSPGCCSPCTRRTACRPRSTPPSSSGGCSSCRAAGPIGLRDALLEAAGEEQGNRLFDALRRRLPGLLPGAGRRPRGRSRHPEHRPAVARPEPAIWR